MWGGRPEEYYKAEQEEVAHSQLNGAITEIVAIKERGRPHFGREREMIQRGVKIRIINQMKGYRFNHVKMNSERRASPYMGTVFHLRASKSHM